MNSGFTIIVCSCHQQPQNVCVCVYTLRNNQSCFLFIPISIPLSRTLFSYLSPFNARILNAIMIIPIGLHSTISTIKAVPKLTFCFDSYVLCFNCCHTFHRQLARVFDAQLFQLLYSGFFSRCSALPSHSCSLSLCLFRFHSLRHYKYILHV